MSKTRLDSPLTASTLKVETLVARVMKGEVRVPRFQRPLRWRSAQVRDLFDSIWNNYPLGTLLFWSREAPEAALRLGKLAIDAPARSDALFVVDGQQRIAALANVLLHPSPSHSSADIWALWFDLETERLLTSGERAVAGPSGIYVPMNVVLDAVALQVWCTDQGLTTDTRLFRKALLLGARVREFVIPTYTVESEDEQVLQRIFTRLNTAGLSMKQHEVFSALVHRDGLPGPLELARGCFTDAGLGRGVNEDLLLQCLRAGAGEDLSAPPSFGGRGPGAARDFTGPLSLALEFLRDELGVRHHRLLPARWPLLVLVRLLRLHPELGPRDVELVRRWFWRGLVSRRSVDMERQRLRWIHEHVTDDLAGTLRSLLADAGRPDEAEIDAFVGEALAPPERSAAAVEVRVGLNLLAQLGPRDALSGELLDLSALIDAAGAAAYGRAPEPAGAHRWRLLHPRVPGLVAALRAAPPDVAASHAWVADDPDGALRAQALRDHFGATLRLWCGHGHSDHLSRALAFRGLEDEE